MSSIELEINKGGYIMFEFFRKETALQAATRQVSEAMPLLQGAAYAATALAGLAALAETLLRPSTDKQMEALLTAYEKRREAEGEKAKATA